jgi:NitT/TauT family transport system ATP-binding protein
MSGAVVAAIEVAAAEKVYPNGTRALAGVDLAVREGEFVTLLGPSGCGKSTLLRMIAGLVAPSRGRVELWGGPVDSIEASGHRLAFVFQSPTLMPWASVERNVRLPLDLRRVPRPQAEAGSRSALDLVGLLPFSRHYPRELSGGMQMRVSIARALATEPTLLLMDEPFGALDEISRNRLDSDLLALWQRQRLTIVFVTHSIFEAVYLSTRVAVMAARPGRVVEDVEIDAPYPRGPEFRVSAAFSGYAQRLQQALQRASALGGEDAGGEVDRDAHAEVHA